MQRPLISKDLILDMPATVMSTVRPPAAARGEAERIVIAKSWPQRVLLQNNSPVPGDIFLSSTAAGLNGARSIVPAGVTALVVAPGQDLWAVSASGAERMSLATSGPIQYARRQKNREKMRPSTFESVTIAIAAGEANSPPKILEPDDVPRRVQLSVNDAIGGSFVFIAFGAGAALSEAQSFRIVAGNVYTLVIAPKQELFATSPAGQPRTVNIHASDLITSAARGATGIPGPAGQE